MTVLQTAGVLETPVQSASLVLGLAILSGVLAGAVAFVYRWYVRQRVHGGMPILVGLSAVAAERNATTALGQVIGGRGRALSTEVALFNVAAFVVAGFAAAAGVRAGDRIARDLFAATGTRDIDGEVSRVVEAVGRVISVELPGEIEDIVGYDPVADETKEALAGRTFLFPRRLTVADLEARVRDRIKTDYGVGHVDLELADDGSVEYLALGRRVAGIGPTLPPETAAVAVRADPAFAASAGDLVQVWTTDPTERVATAEVRGVAGDVVTLAVDAADTPKFDSDTRYRLVTLPVETRPDREFASLLRAADETMDVIGVETGSVLAGQPIGSLDVVVVAIRPAGGSVEALPARTRTLDPGDDLYAVARPELLRKLETAATGPADAAAEIDVEEPTEDDD